MVRTEPTKLFVTTFDTTVHGDYRATTLKSSLLQGSVIRATLVRRSTMKYREKSESMRGTWGPNGNATVAKTAGKLPYSMPTANVPIPYGRMGRVATPVRKLKVGEAAKTPVTDNKAAKCTTIEPLQGTFLPGPPSMTRTIKRGRRVEAEGLAAQRQQQSSPLKVPSVVYLQSENGVVHSSAGSAKVEQDMMDVLPRLEAESVPGFDFDASTISASPSVHSLREDIEESCMVYLGDSAMDTDAEEKAERCPSERREPFQLNPDAPTFVPSRDAKKRASAGSTFARVFCRPSAVHQQIAAASPELSLPMNSASTTSPRPPSAFTKPFPLLPVVGRCSVSSRSPKVTVISEELKIFVVDLLSEEECNWTLRYTEQHVANAIASDRGSWRKLFTHTKLDLPCCEVLALRCVTNRLLMQIRHIVGKTLNARRAASRLVPRSWKEPHLLRYQKIPGQLEHSGMIMHYDGGDLTWQVMLSSPGVDFTGESREDQLPRLLVALNL